MHSRSRSRDGIPHLAGAPQIHLRLHPSTPFSSCHGTFTSACDRSRIHQRYRSSVDAMLAQGTLLGRQALAPSAHSTVLHLPSFAPPRCLAALRHSRTACLQHRTRQALAWGRLSGAPVCSTSAEQLGAQHSSSTEVGRHASFCLSACKKRYWYGFGRLPGAGQALNGCCGHATEPCCPLDRPLTVASASPEPLPRCKLRLH